MIKAIQRSRVPGWVQTCSCHPQLDCKFKLPGIIMDNNLIGLFIILRKASSWAGPPRPLNFGFVSSLSIKLVVSLGHIFSVTICVPYLPAPLLACK